MRIRSQLAGVLRNAPMAPVLLVIVVVFGATSPGFLSAFSVQSILMDSSILATAALGGMLVFLVSGIDLSVGATIAGAAVSAAIAGQATQNPLVALLVGCGVGGLVGLVNGLLIGFARFVPFIVTLAMMLAVTALAYLGAATWSGGGTAGAVPLLPEIALAGRTQIAGIPYIFIVALLITALVAVMLAKTRLGRKIRLVGQNENAARFSGISVARVKLMVYVLAGLLSGIAGCLLSMRIGAGSPAVGGVLLLQVITAIIIGGTTLEGGHGGALRTLFGALVIVALNQGLSTLGFQFWDQNIVLGVVILLGTQISRWVGQRRRIA